MKLLFCFKASQVEVYEKQFLVAKNINKECAFMSTSWGLGKSWDITLEIHTKILMIWKMK